TSFVLSVLTCALGLVGNALVIWVTGFHMKKHVGKIWFLNLAVADIVFVFCLPLYCVALFTDKWLFGRYLCKIYNYVSTCNMYASIFIITTLTIDRVLATAKPIWHHNFSSRCVCYATCTVIWVITALSSLPIFFLSDEVIYQENVQCKLVYVKQRITTHRLSNRDVTAPPFLGAPLDTYPAPQSACEVDIVETYFLTNCVIIPFLVVGYFIPLFVILFSNVIIAQQVRKSESVNTSRLYRIIITVILFFFITWTPVVIAQIILLVSLHNRNLILMSQMHRFMPLMTSIAYTNSCINPFIYALVGTQLRAEITDFISSKRQLLSRSSTSGKSYAEP
ncbi:C3a anaphylatoxin chemotactic receptor-like, partial [Xenopus laevis]|uniref:C3a anaphylatoxin chemotactic receptor-like n=1 Tax=Xenopus laevis TaxID=8355 RepID=A0A8J1LUD5_XENLA